MAPYTTVLAEGLRQRGNQIRVLTAHPHYPTWCRFEGFSGWNARERSNGVAIQRMAHYIPRNPTPLRRALSELTFGARLMFERWGNPDIVVLVSPALMATGMALAVKRFKSPRAASVVWVQDLYSEGVASSVGALSHFASVSKWIESATLRTADQVVVIHEHFRSALLELGVRPACIVVIPNWSNIDVLRADGRTLTRERLGWSADETVVLHAGAIGAKQGLENVVNAARLADSANAPIRFVLVGEGNRAATVKAAAVGVKRVSFMGTVPQAEFEQILAAADVLLVNERPGVEDMSVPSKLTTYFASGLPVVAATVRTSTTAAVLGASQGGIRVEPGDPAALLEAVGKLGADPAMRRRFGEAGLAYRARMLDRETAIDMYAQVLERSVREVRARRRGRFA
ncbi:glycosyltransferase family 4 protein [Agromyces sp. MMS24-JH15]|uniref:glycosyltransferase family 4 protein n=1 Tax=Agromyces sp. MMS24-JH15 TaxID=3243765 RepID=UPI00374A1FFD